MTQTDLSEGKRILIVKERPILFPKKKWRITTFLNDILDAKEKGKSTWLNWLEMLTDGYWKKRFGPDWKNKDKTFWENFPDHD